MVTAIVLKLSE